MTSQVPLSSTNKRSTNAKTNNNILTNNKKVSSSNTSQRPLAIPNSDISSIALLVPAQTQRLPTNEVGIGNSTTGKVKKTVVKKKKDKANTTNNTSSSSSSSSSSTQVSTNVTTNIMGQENEDALDYNEEEDYEEDQEDPLQDSQDLQDPNACSSIDGNTITTTGTSKETSSRNTNGNVGSATGNLYSSGLYSLGGFFGLHSGNNSSNGNAYSVHSQSERDLVARRQQAMLPVTVNTNNIPSSVTNHRINNSSLTMGVGSSCSGGVGSGSGGIDFQNEMANRRNKNSSNIMTSTDNNSHSNSSISSSTKQSIDTSKVRIVNPEGYNSPANALRHEDLEVNNEKYQLLLASPHMSSHAVKHPILEKSYVYVTDGIVCSLVCINPHLDIITKLIFYRMSERGLVLKKSEAGHGDEVYSRLIAVENITRNKFHAIINPKLVSLIYSSPNSIEYIKKWRQMGHSFLLTLKSKLNGFNGR